MYISELHKNAFFLARTTSITSKGQDGKLENMEKPEQFPNLNPIKLLWDELDRINVRVPGSST